MADWGKADPVAPGWGRDDPVAPPTGNGSFKAPFDLSRGYEGVTIPKGSYYRDAGGNIRRNENGLLRPNGKPQGNPIVARNGERPKVLPDVGKSAVTGAIQGLDPFLGASGDLRNGLGNIDGFGAVRAWRGGLEGIGAGARRKAEQLRGSGRPGFAEIGDAALGAMDLVDAFNPLMLGGRASPDSGQVAGARQSLMGPDYQPQTKAGEYARAGGRMLPNALLGGGGIGSRAAQVVAPAVVGQASRDVAAGLGAGERGQAAAEMAGQVVGGVASGVRFSPPVRTARPAAQPPIDKFAKIARTDPALARSAAEEFRAAGISPTLADVTDDAGRGVLRDVSSRMTPARQAVTDFNDARVASLPGRIGSQARRVMSQDPRNPIEIQADLTAQRSAAGDVAFGAVRSERFTPDPQTVMALRSPDGRAAIDAAARMSLNSLDPAEREVGAELSRLAATVLDDPSTQITVGMAQQISKSLLDAGDVATRGGSGRAGSLLTSLGRAVRDDARTNVPGYDAALRQYESGSRLIDAAEVGGDFLKRNTDEFAASVAQMTPEEQALARATGRRALEARAGESIGGAPGLARTVALAPEQQARNAALLGQQDATTLQNALRLESMAVRNANDIAPRIGPQSANRLMDSQAVGAVEQGAGAMADAAMGNTMGLARRAWTWFKTRGIDDKEAEALARAAIDPAQLDGVLTYLEQRYGPQAAQEFLTFRREAAIAPAALATGAAARPSGAQEDQGQAPR